MSVLLTYDGSDAAFYVNGVEVSETITAGSETGKPLRIGVGTQDDGSSRSLFGTTNTFEMHDLALNSDEAKLVSG